MVDKKVIIGALVSLAVGLAVASLSHIIWQSPLPPPTTASIKITSFYPKVFSDINCRSQAPIGSPTYPCGSLTGEVQNEGNGPATSCRVSYEINPLDVASASGSGPTSNYKITDPQLFDLYPNTKHSFDTFVWYKYGKGSYDIFAQVDCDQTSSIRILAKTPV